MRKTFKSMNFENKGRASNCFRKSEIFMDTRRILESQRTFEKATVNYQITTVNYQITTIINEIKVKLKGLSPVQYRTKSFG